MKRHFVVLFCAVVGLGLASGLASAGKKHGESSRYELIQLPRQSGNPPESDGSMFRAAAVGTTVLGWWQFDTATGQPDGQGWTAVDITAQISTFFHVDGPGCNGVAAINGTKSMWCGQWAAPMVPYCGWLELPGYGNNWDQSLISAVGASSITYTCMWDSEPGYDFTYVEYYDNVGGTWVALPVNWGAGFYDGAGGPLTESFTFTGPTVVRFHFTSNRIGSDEDGLKKTTEGAFKVDDIQLDANPVEDWEAEACGQLLSDDAVWQAMPAPEYGLYAALNSAAMIVQEDQCLHPQSNLLTFFDDPQVTNYACGGWPGQGAVPYGPDANGLYINNEVWSPWVPMTSVGQQFQLQFLGYWDMPIDNLQFLVWHVRTRSYDECPTVWKDFQAIYYGGAGTWDRPLFDIGSLVDELAVEIQVAVGLVDLCGVWCGVVGSGNCHSHAPLIDQVRLVRVQTWGPQWHVNYWNLWQDNFPEEGGVCDTCYARCDMAADILPRANPAILPGDSLVVFVDDTHWGLADDPNGGRPAKAVYVYVRVTDRTGNEVAAKRGIAIQSPDNKAWAGDDSGLLRWPWVGNQILNVNDQTQTWSTFRMDSCFEPSGLPVPGMYCVDLMDVDGVTSDHHANENHAANTGVFAPGDVIHYFLGAVNSEGNPRYWYRSLNGQGPPRTTGLITRAAADACEWSVLPDAGRSQEGDILFVDDTENEGEVDPAQRYFDSAFKAMGIDNLVDRYDVLAAGSESGNSLASRVKNYQSQLIGDDAEIYRKVLWNSGEYYGMGDGGTPNGGSSVEKSDDFSLCYFFLDQHPGNPAWAYWGDLVTSEWSWLTGAGANAVWNKFMNHTLFTGDQNEYTGVISPRVLVSVDPAPAAPWFVPQETFFVDGGCPFINAFDSPAPAVNSRIAYRYHDATTGPPAAISQLTQNSASSTARFYLAGYGFEHISDDDQDGVTDRSKHLHELIVWFNNAVPDPVGVEPMAFENRLDNAFPNPFNPTTTIRYSIKDRAHVSLEIYNVAGQLVKTLVNEIQTPTAQGFAVHWDGSNNAGGEVSSGVYFYKLVTKNFTDTKKVVLLK